MYEIKAQSFHAGDIVAFGQSDGADIKWRILAVDGKEALITACCGVGLHAYHDDPSPALWRDCSLRKWLNTDFVSTVFSPGEREKICPVILPDEADDDDDLSLTDENGAADKIFILSEAEAQRYFAGPSDRMLPYSQSVSGTWSFGSGLMRTCRWWLRGKTEGFNGRSCAPVCDHDGTFGGYQTASSPRMAVRPALWVDTSALRPAALPDIGSLGARLKTGEAGTLTCFTGGHEDQRDVLARFVDYETREEYVIYRPAWSDGEPEVARMVPDPDVGGTVRQKAGAITQFLSRYPYDTAAEMLQKKLDEARVRAWTNQMAWSPTPGECMDVKEGGTVRFGAISPGRGKKRRPLEWLALRRIGSKALLIAKEGLKCDTFMEDGSEEQAWEHSQIRAWLNGAFYRDCFTREEKRRIQHCMTECGDLLGRVNEKGMVFDHVFLLSDAEASLFFDSDAARVIRGTPNDVPCLLEQSDEDSPDWWWLRSPGRTNDCVCCVDPDGRVDRRGAWVHSTVCAIRPAILIDLSDPPAPQAAR